MQLAKVQLCVVLQVLRDAETRICSVVGKIGEVIAKKFSDVLTANRGLSTMQAVAALLRGERLNADADLRLPTNAGWFKYAPITSCDTERTFSQFKSVFRANRESFTFEHLHEHMIVHCNQF